MDSSIYGALVRLSQDWVMRYPLIDFHGNQGSIIGDGPAASRYTEGRLTKLVEEGMLKGIKKEVVDFIPNYDDTEVEPITLPSLFPNLLCNPNSGIGVAMACNWLPHNLNEVAEAIFAYIKGEEPTLPGPDFPTGGLIINGKDLPSILETGHGSVKVRGKYEIKKQDIVFYEIPYGTTVEGLLAEIGKACEDKLIEGISDIRDETNKKGIRIVIECEKNVDPNAVVAKLFAKTSLQTSISYNQVALVDKIPTELGLKDCLKIYVDHNIECIKREAEYDKKAAAARLEIVDGLIKALEDIDNIITLIKKSASSADAKDNLIKTYKFTESQAKAIVGMRLGSLARLEKVELNNERAELISKIKEYDILINDKKAREAELTVRLSALVKKFGDKRRTEIVNIEIPKEEKEIEEVIPEDCVVILTQSGEIKRVPAASFKVQKRNGKGVKTAESAVLETISTNTIDTLMLFSSLGKMYRLLVDNVPTGTNISKGISVHTIIKTEPGEQIIAMTSLHRKTNAEFAIFFTKNGMIKKTSIEEYTKVKRSTGILALNLKEGDTLANVTFLKDEEVIVITKQGMSIRFETASINPIGRAAAGVKSIKLADNDEVLIGLPVHKETDFVAVVGENGVGKKVPVSEFPLQARAGKGLIIYKSPLAGAAMIDDSDNLLLIGQPNSICIAAKELPEVQRIAQGNVLIKESKINRIVKF